MELCLIRNRTFPANQTRSKSATFFLTRRLALVAPPRFSHWPVSDPPAALGDSAFIYSDNVKMVFPQSQSSRLLSFLSCAWAGEWDLQINPIKCSCLTVGSLPHLSPWQTPTTKFPRSPPFKTWGSPSTRIQQGVCCSWSEDPSVNYQRQCSPHSTAP